MNSKMKLDKAFSFDNLVKLSARCFTTSTSNAIIIITIPRYKPLSGKKTKAK